MRRPTVRRWFVIIMLLSWYSPVSGVVSTWDEKEEEEAHARNNLCIIHRRRELETGVVYPLASSLFYYSNRLPPLDGT